MFFSPVAASLYRTRSAAPAWRGVGVSPSLSRFLEEALETSAASNCSRHVAQDETSYTLSFDVPGVAKDQLEIGIEGSVVRIKTKPEASRQYQSAWELPQDIDVSASDARLENGVLTLKLAKQVPVSKVSTLTVN